MTLIEMATKRAIDVFLIAYKAEYLP